MCILNLGYLDHKCQSATTHTYIHTHRLYVLNNQSRSWYFIVLCSSENFLFKVLRMYDSSAVVDPTVV